MSNSSILYSRRASFNEKLYLAGETFRPGFCIQLVIEEQGAAPSSPLSVAELESAVARAAEANPGSRLVLRGVLGWTRWVAEGPVPPVRVIPNWEIDALPPAEIERTLSFANGPTCEVVFAPSAQGQGHVQNARIVFRCFHGVMDGRGLLHFAEEVFRALRGEPLLGSPCTENDTEIVTSMVGKKKRPFLKSDCSLIVPASSASSASSASDAASNSGALTPRGVGWNAIVLEGAIPGLVAKISSFLAKHAAENETARTRVMIPVDLRNYKRDLQSSGNMSYPLFIEVSVAQTWSDIQRSILKRLAAKEPMRLDPLESFVPWLPLWLFGIIYRLWIGAQRRSGKYPFSALVTHLALQTIAPLRSSGPEREFEGGTPYFLPPQTDFIPLTISAVTTVSSARLIVSAPRSLMSERVLFQLCEALRASLTA